MPLLLELGKGERCVINGAVIESANATAKIFVHNQSNILRYGEIMIQEEAVTPAANVYYSLQCAYIFTDKREGYLFDFHNFLQDFLTAVPSSAKIVDTIQDLVAKKEYYKALKQVRVLLDYEYKVLNDAPVSMDQLQEIQNATAEQQDIIKKPVIKPNESIMDLLNDEPTDLQPADEK